MSFLRRVSCIQPWACLLLLLWASRPTATSAHPVSISRALVYVSTETLTAEVEVFLEDLFLFHELTSDSRDYLPPSEIDRGIALHCQFIRNRFQILDVHGETIAPLSVRLSSWKRDIPEGTETPLREDGVPQVGGERPDDGVAIAALMTHRLNFALTYPRFAAPPPFLTFVQSFSNGDAVLPSEMTLFVQQEIGPDSQPIPLRARVPRIVAFDWTIPSEGTVTVEQRRADWLARIRLQSLGIVDYSAVYSFVYVEPTKIRHEILLPIRTLLQILDLPQNDGRFMSPGDQDSGSAMIITHFSDRIQVAFDGQRLEADAVSCQFFGLAERDFAVEPKRANVSIDSGRVGIIFSYSRQDTASKLSLEWNTFSEDWWAVDVVVMDGPTIYKQTLTRIGGRNRLRYSVRNDAPKHTVRQVNATPPAKRIMKGRMLAIAFITTLTLGGGLLVPQRRRRRLGVTAMTIVLWVGLGVALGKDFFFEPQPITGGEAKAVFTELHRNVYHALQAPTQDSIYDALALSVDGELLDQTYRRIQKSLRLTDQGGAVAQVTDVRHVGGDLLQSTSGRDREFRYRCEWDVSGMVEHWGHRHARQLGHEAIFRIQDTGGQWKIVDWEIVNERVLGTTVSVRED